MRLATLVADFDSNVGGEVDLCISGESEKRIDAAMVFVKAFRKAYGKNPERFNPDAVRQRDFDGDKKERGQKKSRKFY